MMIFGLTVSICAFFAVLLWWTLPRLLAPPRETSNWQTFDTET
jgi:hypothetical protein